MLYQPRLQLRGILTALDPTMLPRSTEIVQGPKSKLLSISYHLLRAVNRDAISRACALYISIKVLASVVLLSHVECSNLRTKYGMKNCILQFLWAIFQSRFQSQINKARRWYVYINKCLSCISAGNCW